MIFELWINPTKQSAVSLGETLKNAIIKKNHTVITDQNNCNILSDIIIGLGGDGTLLTMLRQKNYNTYAKYIGINCGTLGFLQDMQINNIYNFIDNIPTFKTEQLFFLKVEVKNNSESIFLKNYALNEFLITAPNHKCLNANLYLEGSFLESFSGTGIITCTPTGSTGLNLSAGGSILFPGIKAYELTFKDPIQSAVHRCLDKSIIVPSSKKFTIKPNSQFDTEQNIIDIIADNNCIYQGVYSEINICYSKKSITKTIDNYSDFTNKISSKLIK